MTKILLVDDSKFLRMATERALARAGYVVITASDGPKAIELAKTDKPDVILLDMLLPGMTGPDVLMALKKDSGTAGDSGGGVHRAIAEERDAATEGWSVRIPGEIRAGTG